MQALGRRAMLGHIEPEVVYALLPQPKGEHNTPPFCAGMWIGDSAALGGTDLGQRCEPYTKCMSASWRIDCLLDFRVLWVLLSGFMVSDKLAPIHVLLSHILPITRAAALEAGRCNADRRICGEGMPTSPGRRCFVLPYLIHCSQGMPVGATKLNGRLMAMSLGVTSQLVF